MKVLLKEEISQSEKDLILHLLAHLGIRFRQGGGSVIETQRLSDYFPPIFKCLPGVADVQESFPGETTADWWD